MAAVWTLASSVVADAVRKKFVYALLIFSLILVLTVPLIPSFEVGVRLPLFYDLALGLVSLFAIVLSVVLTAGQVTTEIERRTIYNLLSKPVRRSQFIFGKYLGILMVMLGFLGLMAVEIFIVSWSIFSALDLSILQAVWTSYLEVIVVSAFVLMSSVFLTTTESVFLAILFYFIGHIKMSFLQSVLPKEMDLAQKSIWYLVYYLLPTLENFNLNDPVAHGVHAPAAYLIKLTLYAFVFAAVFLVIGIIVFQRKDI